MQSGKPAFFFAAHDELRADWEENSAWTTPTWYANPPVDSYYQGTCPYCERDCRVEFQETEFAGGTGFQEDSLAFCSQCGWWAFECKQENTSGSPHIFSARAVLQTFTIDSQEVPVHVLGEELIRRPNMLAHIDPIKMEELVASIWSSHLGYKVESCSYGRPDRGIDIVVLRHDTGRTAIQVKRYKHPIELGEIHRFAGAMLASDFRRGVFVTSGRFRSGCRVEASEIERRAELTIDLVDGKRLLEFMEVGVTQTPGKDPDRPCPYWDNYGYHRWKRPLLGASAPTKW